MARLATVAAACTLGATVPSLAQAQETFRVGIVSFLSGQAADSFGIPAVNGEMGSVKRSTFLGEPNDGEIRNDNQTLDVALEHVLNDNWTLRGGVQYLDGELSGGAVENNSNAYTGLPAGASTIGRNS